MTLFHNLCFICAVTLLYTTCPPNYGVYIPYVRKSMVVPKYNTKPLFL